VITSNDPSSKSEITRMSWGSHFASRESAVRSAVFFFIAELFKVVDGKINRIEALVTPVPYGMYTGWPAKK
jgi:hypothetical protein